MEKLETVYKEMINSSTQYSGEKKSHRKILSASGLNIDQIAWRLKYEHGLIERDELGQNTIGTIFQLGVDKCASNNGNIVSAIRFEVNLINGFILSGEIDQLITIGNTIWIIDNKVIKHSRFMGIKKKGAYDDYALQVRAYKYLLEENNKFKGYNIRMALACWFKDGTKFGSKPKSDFELYEVEDNFSSSEFETEIIYPKLLDLEDSLKVNIEDLDQCSNLLWNNKGKGETSEPMKCKYFCEHNIYCPHYKKYNKGAGHKNLINLISKL